MTSTPHMNSYFDDFLKNIRLSKSQKATLVEAHTRLRDELEADASLQDMLINTFLQGSYRRSTIIKPAAGQSSDVDVVVVTNIDEEDYTPAEALDLFKGFLDKNYPGQYERQGRSWGIHVDGADIDLVPTSAPSEALSKSEALKDMVFSTLDVESFADSSELSKAYGSRTAVNIRDILEKDDWKDEALRIPDREADVWEWTDPLSQIGWTIDKNARCSGRYVNVVKALKWWWRTQHPDKKYPKGYPLEHLIGDCCPDGIESVAEGVVLTLENIAKMGPSKPILLDRGLPNDVMARVSQDDYSTFHECVIEASCLAREAFAAEDARVASEKWQELFGAEFPLAPKSESKAAFTARAGAATILSEANFA
ncbi:nucleotidyltransferase [Rubneribacter badeniensis]|uniref:Nucleotidyltransferase n=1 Tax=Rubneribacter badeniensis TaxID=2070688 RepID=A0A2K2U6C9_9ACTN|nr:nucleotidyltransferase [Rubneribacter badeniensis]PNV65867.1 nucleotidyltransferase [Rubneribacter badeniensis]